MRRSLPTELEQLIELDQLPDLIALSDAAGAAPRRSCRTCWCELPVLAGYDALAGGAGMSAARRDQVDGWA